MTEFSIVENARAIVPLIHEERLAGDAQARLSDRVVEACGTAGLFRMSAPHEVGGLEADLTKMVAATELVCAADPAVGWYIQNSMVGWHGAAFLSAGVREKVYQNPNLHFGNATQNTAHAQVVPGGYRLSGTWPVVTGVEHSSWCTVVGTLMDGDTPRLVDDAPETRTFIVPTGALEIKQTWQGVSAMRGTGSNMVKATDVYVADDFAFGSDTAAHIDRPYCRTPGIALQMPVIAGVSLGVLGPVLDSVIEAMAGHTAAFTGEARRDQAVSQDLIATSRARYRSLRAGIYDVAREIDETLHRQEDLPDLLRAESYALSMYTVDACRVLASDIFAGGTRDAFMKDNPAERALKDLHAIGYIMAAARFLQHSAGRVFLGGDHNPGL